MDIIEDNNNTVDQTPVSAEAEENTSVNQEETTEKIPEYVLSCATTFGDEEEKDLSKYLGRGVKIKYLIIALLGGVCAGFFVFMQEYVWFVVALGEIAFCIFGAVLNLRRIGTLCAGMKDIFSKPVNVDFFADRLRAEIEGESISYGYSDLRKAVEMNSMWALYLGTATSSVILPVSKKGFGEEGKAGEFDALIRKNLKGNKIKRVIK